MLKNKLHYLIGVATGTAFSYGLISAQWLQPAQAAVLTSNFEIYDYSGPGFDGFPSLFCCSPKLPLSLFLPCS